MCVRTQEAGEGCTHLSAQPVCGTGVRITDLVPSLGAESTFTPFLRDAQSHAAVSTEQ